MIRAEDNVFAHWIIDKYLNFLLKKDFGKIIFSGKIQNTNEPLVITPNHISWWDGFFIYYAVKKHFKRIPHILMLEDQLEKYWFFKYTGCFGINPKNPSSIIEASDYIAEILNEKNSCVVIYIQGEIEPQDKKPLSIKSGLKYFLRKAPAETNLLNCAFRIQYGVKRKPDVFYKFSEFCPLSRFNLHPDAYYDDFLSNISGLEKESINSLIQENE